MVHVREIRPLGMNALHGIAASDSPGKSPSEPRTPLGNSWTTPLLVAPASCRQMPPDGGAMLSTRLLDTSMVSRCSTYHKVPFLLRGIPQNEGLKNVPYFYLGDFVARVVRELPLQAGSQEFEPPNPELVERQQLPVRRANEFLADNWRVFSECDRPSRTCYAG